MPERLRYLLLQVRNPDDPMREQEARSFVRALHTTPAQLDVFDLLSRPLLASDCQRADVILLGGAGHYSVAQNVGEAGPWLEQALASLRLVYELGRPMFASCWGFQALARVLGGRVERHRDRAEVGTHALQLTDEGLADPVFGPLGREFFGQSGHEDHVVELPPGAVRLATSPLAVNQAYRLSDRPVYCTQFHPELNREDLMGRVQAYPHYVEEVAGIPFEQFASSVRDTPETEQLLRRFAEQAVGQRSVSSRE